MTENSQKASAVPHTELPECGALLQRLYARIPNPSRIAFLSTLCIGLLTHLSVFLFDLPNHDTIKNMFTDNDVLSSGRWFLFVPSALSGRFNVPWINGILSLIALGIACAFIVSMLKIRKPVWVILTSAVIVTFPAVACTYAYIFTADAYFIAVALAALGAYAVERFRFGFLIGGVLLGFSMGIYQVYIFFALSLMGIRGILLLLDNEVTNRQIWIRLAQYIGALAIGCIVYKVGLECMLWFRGVQLSDYQGVDVLDDFKIYQFFRNAPQVYVSFYQYYASKTSMFLTKLMRLALLISSVAIVVLILVHAAAKRVSAFRYVLTGCIFLAAPLMFNGIWMIATYMHELMLLPMCLLYVSAIALFENLPPIPSQQRRRILRTLSGYVLALTMTIASIQGAYYASRAYKASQLKFEHACSFYNRVIYRVEALPEYTHDTPVYFANLDYLYRNYDLYLDDIYPFMAGNVEFNYGLFSMFLTKGNVHTFLRNYMGVSFVAPKADSVEAILQSEAYAAMPSYPAEGCVKMIDGVIVVQLCDESDGDRYRLNHGLPEGQ